MHPVGVVGGGERPDGLWVGERDQRDASEIGDKLQWKKKIIRLN